MVYKIFLFVLIIVVLSIGVFLYGKNRSIFPQITTKCVSISKEQVIATIKNLPEVKQYLLSPVINSDGTISYEYFVEEDKTQSTKDTKNIWVYAYVRYKDSPEENHAVTFNRYSVNNCSGKIKCSLHIYDKGKYIRMSNYDEYPCDPIKEKYKAVFNYICEEGKSIEAEYSNQQLAIESYDGKVAVKLNDGRSYDFIQIPAASGTRFAKSENDLSVVFWSKSNTAFFQENNVITYKKCVTK